MNKTLYVFKAQLDVHTTRTLLTEIFSMHYVVNSIITTHV